MTGKIRVPGEEDQEDIAILEESYLPDVAMCVLPDGMAV